MPAIYLDHNATTPLDPDAALAMVECARQFPANPSSQHAGGRRARARLDDELDRLGRLLGLPATGGGAARLLVTSGGTEANNLALLGLAGEPPARVLVAAIEHPSVLGPAAELVRRGHQVELIGVDSQGRVDLDHLGDLLGDDTRLASIQLANHETGVIQPVAEAAAICARRAVPLHTDAVQAVGKIEVDASALGVAAISAAAHKFHGPIGVGLLAVDRSLDLKPLLHGGFQQEGLRPGTDPLPLVVGMRVALEKWHANREARTAAMIAGRDLLENTLLTDYPQAVVHGAAAPRLPQTSNISFVGLDRQALLMALDLAEIACSAGSACASGSAEPSPVLRAMGRQPAELKSALRFSLGGGTGLDQVRLAAAKIINVCNDLQAAQRPGKNPRAARSGGTNSL